MTTAIDLPVVRRAPANEASLRESPSDVLPDPTEVLGTVVYDAETSGLFVDEGHRVAAVGVAYRLRASEHLIHYHSFAFDQGRAADKGLSVVYLPDTPGNRKRKLDGANVVGKPAGDPDGRWDWDTDYNQPLEEWRTFCDWLIGTGRVCGHTNQNIKFDINMMRAGTRLAPGVELEPFARWDTMLANPWVWPYANSNALKPVAARIWGEDEVAEASVVKEALIEVRKRFGLPAGNPRYDLLPWEVNGPYAAADAVLTLRLAELQEALIEEGVVPNGRLPKAVQLMRVLARMERRGFGPYDVKQSAQIADRIDARIRQVEAKLPFSPATNPRAATYFYDELGMAPWKVTETPRQVGMVPDVRKAAQPGDLQRKVIAQGDLTAAVARRMADAGVPSADDWATILELKRKNGMFYRGYADLAGPDGRLRTNFKQAYVRSNRLSVERFQAQAMPKHLGMVLDGVELPEPRTLFDIRPGYKRMNLDLGQAELRIASHFCGCETMSKALVTGTDFHGITTERIFGITKSAPDWLLKRDIGKRCTFASIFQVGPKTFRETLWEEAAIEWSLNECKRVIYAWRDAYPEFGRAYYRWMEFAEANHYVPLVDGQPSWLTGPRDYPNTAWNRVVQGSLALFCTDWLIEIEKATEQFDALVLTVHDSAVLELPEQVADSVCESLVKMTEALWFDRFGIPGKVDWGPWIKG